MTHSTPQTRNKKRSQINQNRMQNPISSAHGAETFVSQHSTIPIGGPSRTLTLINQSSSGSSAPKTQRQTNTGVIRLTSSHQASATITALPSHKMSVASESAINAQST